MVAKDRELGRRYSSVRMRLSGIPIDGQRFTEVKGERQVLLMVAVVESWGPSKIRSRSESGYL